MLVDRSLISKKFKCITENSDVIFDHSALVDMINYWKVLYVEKYQLNTGDRVGLGFAVIDIFYFGALLAAAELGLKLVILDTNSYSRSKVEGYYPLHLFLKKHNTQFQGLERIEANSLLIDDAEIFNTYTIQHPSRFKEYTNKFCSSEDTVMLCTSSGTTGMPKLISHSHEFIAGVSARNADLLRFHGRVCHTKNLHHGSSLATYWLPALISDACEMHHIFQIKENEYIEKSVGYFLQENINHVQFSYQKELEFFLQTSLDQKARYQDLTIHTLGYIDPTWQKYLMELGNVKIISIFGSNETSGPIFTNELNVSSKEFDPRKFTLCDDFYSICKNDANQIEVSLPYYEHRTVVMQDNFHIEGRVFNHRGRSDMFRIGETAFDANWFLTLTGALQIDGQLVFDSIRQKIYYADWGSGDLAENVGSINAALSTHGVEISAYRQLDYKSFIYGIKIDHDMIREFFRNEQS